jgi:hypothetical protein
MLRSAQEGNEAMTDPVEMFFTTAPIEAIRRHQKRREIADPQELAVEKWAIAKCRQEHPLLKLVEIDASGSLVFQRIPSIQGEPQGHA